MRQLGRLSGLMALQVGISYLPDNFRCSLDMTWNSGRRGLQVGPEGVARS